MAKAATAMTGLGPRSLVRFFAESSLALEESPRRPVLLAENQAVELVVPEDFEGLPLSVVIGAREALPVVSTIGTAPLSRGLDRPRRRPSAPGPPPRQASGRAGPVLRPSHL